MQERLVSLPVNQITHPRWPSKSSFSFLDTVASCIAMLVDLFTVVVSSKARHGAIPLAIFFMRYEHNLVAQL